MREVALKLRPWGWLKLWFLVSQSVREEGGGRRGGEEERGEREDRGGKRRVMRKSTILESFFQERGNGLLATVIVAGCEDPDVSKIRKVLGGEGW